MAIILGIDPGSRVTGYGLINAVGNKLEYVGCGCIRTQTQDFPQRLQIIHAELVKVIEQFSPQQSAVEEVFMGRNASAALKLGHARGAAMVACLSNQLPLAEYSARKVKQAVVGHGGADKALISDVRVFDEFIGGSLGEGKKSLAIAVRLQPKKKTLTEDEIEAVAKKVVAAVTKATGGELRG